MKKLDIMRNNDENWKLIGGKPTKVVTQPKEEEKKEEKEEEKKVVDTEKKVFGPAVSEGIEEIEIREANEYDKKKTKRNRQK